MKKYLLPVLIFITVFFVYFAVGTKFTFRPKWAVDYFNQYAQSLLHFRLDIPHPQSTYDLANYKGKWYLQWGFLPAIFLIPFQLILGRFIPTFYINLFFSSLNVVVFYLLLLQLKKDFFPRLSLRSIILLLVLFAFGTTHFYVGTLGGVWHVSQMTSFFFGLLATYIIFKKKRKMVDYAICAILYSITLIGRPTEFLLIFLPIFLFMWDFLNKRENLFEKSSLLKKGIIIFGLPVILFGSIFLFYNYLRFENIFQFGYSYLKDETGLIKQSHGVSSIGNIPRNMWYMFFEIPSLSFQNGLQLHFNLNGNSIFFLTPPFLTIFLAFPIKKKDNKYEIDPYVLSLWITSIISIIPVLMHFSSGWMQFGYRYSLDITPLLILLSIFGIKGKLNILYIMGILFSIFIYSLGIQALM